MTTEQQKKQKLSNEQLIDQLTNLITYKFIDMITVDDNSVFSEEIKTSKAKEKAFETAKEIVEACIITPRIDHTDRIIEEICREIDEITDHGSDEFEIEIQISENMLIIKGDYTCSYSIDYCKDSNHTEVKHKHSELTGLDCKLVNIEEEEQIFYYDEIKIAKEIEAHIIDILG